MSIEFSKKANETNQSVYTLKKTVEGKTTEIKVIDFDNDGLDSHDGITVKGDTSVFTSTEITENILNNYRGYTGSDTQKKPGEEYVKLPEISFTKNDGKIKVDETKEECSLGSFASLFSAQAQSAASSSSATSTFSTEIYNKFMQQSQMPQMNFSGPSSWQFGSNLESMGAVDTMFDAKNYSGELIDKYTAGATMLFSNAGTYMPNFSGLGYTGESLNTYAGSPLGGFVKGMYSNLLNFFMKRADAETAAALETKKASETKKTDETKDTKETTKKTETKETTKVETEEEKAARIKEEQRVAKEKEEAAKKEAIDKIIEAKTKHDIDVKKHNVSVICKELFLSLKGLGTDEEMLKKNVDRINKDNVLEVLSEWNELYSAKMGGESLIESIEDDSSFGSQIPYFEHIKKALADRSQELGLVKEAKAFDADVTLENNSFWNDPDVCKNAFATMLEEALKAKEEKGEKELTQSEIASVKARAEAEYKKNKKTEINK